MKTTKGRRNNRRSHHGVQTKVMVSEGDVLRPRHRASRVTGMFRGKQVITIKEKKQDEQAEQKKTVEQTDIPTIDEPKG